MWRSVLCVSLVWGLGLGLDLDRNTIRSSKETPQQKGGLPDRIHGDRVERPVRRRTETKKCSTLDCYLPTQVGGCSNRAQRRPFSQDRQVDRQADRQVDRDIFNRTKAPEMSSCVRSGDCASGLCCVRYLTGKRCQRIPVEGEACLLRSSSKLRRKLGRCDCDAGLSCAADRGAEPGRAKGQGVCQPHMGRGQRNTRHSGKKKQTVERSC